MAIGDLVCTAAPIGLFFGRISNFINGELWGRASSLPWAMVFPDKDSGGLPRHPGQLYEAGLEGLVLGLVLCQYLTAGVLYCIPMIIAGVVLMCRAESPLAAAATR